MSRSNNSRRGSTNKHAKRHHNCAVVGFCDYCQGNFKHAERKQAGVKQIKRSGAP
jgi:hypothetical protein